MSAVDLPGRGRGATAVRLPGRAVSALLLAVAIAEDPSGAAFRDRAPAGVCAVPGDHPTVQAAVADPACSQVDLAAQTFTEIVTISRSLTLQGAPSTIQGQLIFRGATSTVVASSLVVDSSAVVFADGLESGDTSAWSSTAP